MLLLMLLCWKWHLHLAVHGLERMERVKVIDQPLQLLDLSLDGLGCFEILSADCFLLSKLKHIQVTSDQLQLVRNLFELHGSVEVFFLDGFLFLFEQYLQLVMEVWVHLFCVYALNPEVAWLERRVVIEDGLLIHHSRTQSPLWSASRNLKRLTSSLEGHYLVVPEVRSQELQLDQSDLVEQIIVIIVVLVQEQLEELASDSHVHCLQLA